MIFLEARKAIYLMSRAKHTRKPIKRIISYMISEETNSYIFYITHSSATKDSLKPSLCRKDSKSVLKVDINWWEGWFKEILTYRTDKQTDRQTFVNRLVKWRKKEHGNWYIFHMCHTIVTIDSLKRSLCHKDSKSVLKVDMNWWEGCFKERLTHRTDKRTDRPTPVIII